MKAAGPLSRWSLRSLLFIAVASAVFGLASGPVMAQPAPSGNAPGQQVDGQQVDGQQSVESVNQRAALEKVRASFPGNIISINEVKQGDRVRFRIRIDNEGNIYTVYVDQLTGAITRE